MAATEIVDKTQETIILAALEHFQIDENTLVTGTKYHIAYMRWCVFLLVKNNTMLSQASIGRRLGKNQFCVRNGIQNLQHRIKFETVIKKDIANISKIAGLLQD